MILVIRPRSFGNRETRLTMDEITAYLPGLSPVENKELCVRFDGGRLSSDGGVLVLREIEKRLGLAARLAGCLADARDPQSTTHSYADMIGARMFAIACGGACPRATPGMTALYERLRGIRRDCPSTTPRRALPALPRHLVELAKC